MGKPSLRRIPKKSDHSFSSSSSTLNSRKMEKKRKNRASITNKSIQKLFDHLRRESESSTAVSETTVIELDNTESPVNIKRELSEVDFIPLHKHKRKNESNTSLIVIKDDNDLITRTEPCHSSFTPKKSKSTSTVQCSTPKNGNNTKDLQDFILNMNNNTLNAQKNFVNEVNDLTKELYSESLFTIDLTGTLNNSSSSNNQNTVIDLVNTTDNADCSVVAVSQASLSMSGDSEVTVIQSPFKKSNEKRMNKYINGLAKMNESQKDRLLKVLTQNIFNGCNVATLPNKVASSFQNLRALTDRSTDTLEDTYIKEVILGRAQSRNSIGSNIYNPERDAKNKTGLRMIIIDGSNVAMEHGKGRVFSVKGLKICIEYFLNRGHVVKAFVPRFRCKFGKSTDPRLLDSLERSGLVVYTPSREIQGRLVASYDDRYIVQCAAEFDGVIVSGDYYRDLHRENPRWRVVIEKRILPFTWVDDMLMLPSDPLGRNGPALETFLRHPN